MRSDDDRDAFGVGMDAVGLVEAGSERDAIQEERVEVDTMPFCKRREDTVEQGAIVAPQVWAARTCRSAAP